LGVTRATDPSTAQAVWPAFPARSLRYRTASLRRSAPFPVNRLVEIGPGLGASNPATVGGSGWRTGCGGTGSRSAGAVAGALCRGVTLRIHQADALKLILPPCVALARRCGWSAICLTTSRRPAVPSAGPSRTSARPAFHAATRRWWIGWRLGRVKRPMVGCR
jgi:hypothetical protein